MKVEKSPKRISIDVILEALGPGAVEKVAEVAIKRKSSKFVALRFSDIDKCRRYINGEKTLATRAGFTRAVLKWISESKQARSNFLSFLTALENTAGADACEPRKGKTKRAAKTSSLQTPSKRFTFGGKS